MSYVEGPELCRLAIANGNEENSDWINTVVGHYYRSSHRTRSDPNPPFYEGIAIAEGLLTGFLYDGSMPEYDFFGMGLTEKARKEADERSKKFFKLIDPDGGI